MKTFKLLFAFVTVALCVNASELNYRWLERAPKWGSYHIDEEISDWLEEQKEQLDQYHAEIDQDGVRQKFLAEYEKKTPYKAATLEDGRKVEVFLAPKAAEHVLTIDGKAILNGSALAELSKNHGEYNLAFNTFMVSPGQKHLAVPLHQNGSSTDMYVLVIELSEEPEIVAFIDDEIRASAITWINQNKIQYSRWFDGESLRVEFDVRNGSKTILNSNEQTFRAVAQGQFLYDISPKDWDDPDSHIQVFRVRPYLAEEFKSVELEIETEKWPSIIGHTDKYFVIATGRWNYEGLIFVGYHYDSKGQFQLGDVKRYDPIKSGSIQRVLVNKGMMIAEYVAGPFRSYRVFDENADMVKFLNAPKAGTLRSFEDLGSGNLKLSWTSQVVSQHEQRFNYKLDQWSPRALNAKLLVDKYGVEFEHYFKFIKSEDGTSVPAFVIHKKELEVNESTPLYVAAYGGHGLVTSLSPRYRFSIHSFMNDGGVFAHPAVRGGGAYGHRWYEQVYGSLVRYQDTASSLRALHEAGIGSPETTVFEGWSNGGLLAGVMLSQYPELFKMVISGNGLHDMVRKDIMKAGGYWAWALEYGGHDSKEEIEFLESYSPLIYAMEDKVYPTVYVMAGDSDRRVNPSHSYKLVAALQDHQQGAGKILLHNFENSGHWPVSVYHEGLSGLEGTIKKWQAIYHELGMTSNSATEVSLEQAH